MTTDILEKLLLQSGISGRENPIREAVIEEIKPYVDSVYVDPLGNVIANKKVTAKK